MADAISKISPVVIDGTTTKQIPASDIKTYAGTTGLTASRCEGLSVKLICTKLPSNSLFEEAPK